MCSLGLPTLNYTEVYGLTATRMKPVKHYVSNPYYASIIYGECDMLCGYRDKGVRHAYTVSRLLALKMVYAVICILLQKFNTALIVASGNTLCV